MGKFSKGSAIIGLAALSLAGPATSAQAGTQGVGCNSKWPGRDGNVRAWEHYDCGGNLLGVTSGNDSNWGNNTGAFQGGEIYQASAVMNSGYIGGRDVVAFYSEPGFSSSYVCLSPQELYADNLTDNYYPGLPGVAVNDNIESHQWVTASACAAGSWLT